MEIYQNNVVSILLDTGINISAYDVYIKYRKPNGISGSWTGTVSNLTKVLYTTSVLDLDTVGIWKLQAFVSGGLYSAHGRVVDLDVRKYLATLTTAAPTTAAP
jgi:hypothetical protein